MLSTLVHPQPVQAMGATGLPHIHPHVDIRIDTGGSAGQELVKGILSYVRSHTTWRVSLPDQRRGRRASKMRVHDNADGIVAQVDTTDDAKWLRNCDVPVVNICGESGDPDFPLIAVDEAAVAEMALAHLVNLGFKHLGVCGRSERRSAKTRIKAFGAQARAIGILVETFEINQGEQWERGRDRFAAWLQGRPKPLGVFACDDPLGQQILDACRMARLSVPREVAVLGVGNDELICGIADPPMSSIVLDNRRMGYEAARRLHRIMEGHFGRTKGLCVPPVEVASRPSTDALVIEDPEVAAAARFIRQHALEGIKVADVLAAVPVSRRVLETRFRSHFGRTLHQEILGVQLDRIKELLRESDLSMSQISTRSGFRHVEYMSVVFKREIGITPSEYRSNWRKRR